MARPGPQAQAKRRREQAKREKRRAKEEKKAQKKALKETGATDPATPDSEEKPQDADRPTEPATD